MLRIFLVVFGDIGHHLVFYHPVPQVPVSIGHQGNAKRVNLSRNPYAVVEAAGPKYLEDEHIPFEKQLVYGYPPKVFAKIFCPKPPLCGQTLEVVIDQLRFLSYPIELSTHNLAHEITFFNVVFALKSSEENPMFEKIVERLARTIEREQKRCGFLSQEYQKIAKIKERSCKTDPPHDIRELNAAILRESSLAVQLRDLRDGLVNRGTARIKVNGWLMHFSLKDPAECPGRPMRAYESLLLLDDENPEQVPPPDPGCAIASASATSGAASGGITETSQLMANHFQASMTSSHDQRQKLREKETILELKTEGKPPEIESEDSEAKLKQKIIAELPKDSSPNLKRLINAANVTKSFQELHQELDIPMPQLFGLAAHLVYWNKARVIPTLSKHNIYVVHPNAKIGTRYEHLKRDFVVQFPGCSLFRILESFSQSPAPLSSHMLILKDIPKKEFVRAVIWMLKHEMVMQLHTYVYLLQDEWGQDSQFSSFTNYPYHQSYYSSPVIYHRAPSRQSSGSSGKEDMEDDRYPNSSGLWRKNPSNQGHPSNQLGWPSVQSNLTWASEDENLDHRERSGSYSRLQSHETVNAALRARMRSNSDHNSAWQPNSHTLGGYSDETEPPTSKLFRSLRVQKYFDGRHHLDEIMYRASCSRKDLNQVLMKYSHVLLTFLHPAPS